jgi:hypothetical protein
MTSRDLQGLTDGLALVVLLISSFYMAAVLFSRWVVSSQRYGKTVARVWAPHLASKKVRDPREVPLFPFRLVVGVVVVIIWVTLRLAQP